ncbi:hypothetical protein PE066_00405 [Ramlibacter tataouinensis]|uniref:hypothetical protein n=1 Tax=Ramlibacter tataouinensis TaxID=94132 RepID=UPI0022F40542|nr:hypothetical protein [Ramlibacter tataouinensis]WBY02035.1 hypothetical protein PE066_00405 [Ramlibacter tataouinensis]
MRWFKSNLRNSIYGLLGHSQPPSQSTLDNRLEEIREAMLDLVGETASQDFPQLTRRIRYAGEIQGLWYLRGELMAALAARHGETIAREQIGGITTLFKGVLPPGLAARPRPLLG